MSLESHNAFLNELEEEFDVWSWQFQGMRYWPLLRLYLWRLLAVEFSANRPPVKPTTTAPVPKTKAPLKPPEKFSSEELHQRVLEAFPERRSADILLLSRYEDNVDFIDEQLHNRLVDPIWRLARTMDLSVEKVEIVRTENLEFQNLAVPAPRINPDGFGNIDIELIAIPELDGLFEKAMARKLNVKRNDPGFRSLLLRTVQRAAVFGALLEVYRPRLVMLGVYYDAFQMAAVQACRSRNIKVVDIQHGKQGAHHGAYTDWLNIPYGGSEFLPDFFWVWGKQTARRIKRGMGFQAVFHRPVICGNAWLAESLSHQHPISDEAQRFFTNQEKFSKRILVTLQPITEPLNTTLLDTLKAAPSDWIWWFRLHNKQRRQFKEIKCRIADTGARFELEIPSELPLYPLIKRADYHLTAWSTVAFEAEAFGCKTSLFHPLGKNILSAEISEGRFQYAENKSELIAQIENNQNRLAKGLKRFFSLRWRRPAPYIITNSTVAKSSIRKMLRVTEKHWGFSLSS